MSLRVQCRFGLNFDSKNVGSRVGRTGVRRHRLRRQVDEIRGRVEDGYYGR